MATSVAVAWHSLDHAEARRITPGSAARVQSSPGATPRPRRTATPAPAFPRAAAVARALGWAQDREGDVGVAVVNSRGVLRGYHAHRQFQSASLSKAMLLVAYLRRHPRPAPAMRATLTTMIEESDNASADIVYDVIGNSGLRTVARIAGMKNFETGTSWIDTEVTAADQARFFYHYQRCLPARSIAFARRLLSSIIAEQRWDPGSRRTSRLECVLQGRLAGRGQHRHESGRLARARRRALVAGRADRRQPDELVRLADAERHHRPAHRARAQRGLPGGGTPVRQVSCTRGAAAETSSVRHDAREADLDDDPRDRLRPS